MTLAFLIGLAIGTSVGLVAGVAWMQRPADAALLLTDRLLEHANDAYTAGRNYERHAHGKELLALPSALREVGL